MAGHEQHITATYLPAFARPDHASHPVVMQRGARTRKRGSRRTPRTSRKISCGRAAGRRAKAHRRRPSVRFPLPSSAPSLPLSSSSVQGQKRVTQSPHPTLLQTRRVSPASPSVSPTGPPSSAAKRCLPRLAPSLTRPSLTHTPPPLPPRSLCDTGVCVSGGASGAAAGAAQHGLHGALRRHAAGGGTHAFR